MEDKNIIRHIEELKSLMYKGNRSKIISSTAMIVWGVIAILMNEISPLFFLKGWFNSLPATIIAVIIFHFSIFSLGMYLEHHFTKKKAEELNDVLDYTFHQILKLLVLLLGLGTYLTIVMAIQGRFGLIYSIWMIIIGIGFYFCGLFTLKIYEYGGLVLIILGVLSSFVPASQAFLVNKAIANVAIGGGCFFLGIYVKKKYGW